MQTKNSVLAFLDAYRHAKHVIVQKNASDNVKNSFLFGSDTPNFSWGGGVERPFKANKTMDSSLYCVEKG